MSLSGHPRTHLSDMFALLACAGTGELFDALFRWCVSVGLMAFICCAVAGRTRRS